MWKKNGFFPSKGGGGVRVEIPAVSLFDFHFSPHFFFKEADIIFFFKVLAKFGDYKDNKDMAGWGQMSVG